MMAILLGFLIFPINHIAMTHDGENHSSPGEDSLRNVPSHVDNSSDNTSLGETCLIAILLGFFNLTH